jgi:hypothetical protein
MIPDAASIARKRYRMPRTLGFSALVLFMIFLVGTVCSVAVAAYEGLFWAGQLFSLSALLRPVVYLSGFLAGAGFLAGYRRRLVVWLLPFPEGGCPRCAYRLEASPGPGCPECGLPLSAQFAEPPG